MEPFSRCDAELFNDAPAKTGKAIGEPMSSYSKRVLPHLLNLAMRHRNLAAYRSRLVPAAQGRVLEIGIGSGLNIPCPPSSGQRGHRARPLRAAAAPGEVARIRRRNPGQDGRRLGRGDPLEDASLRHSSDDLGARFPGTASGLTPSVASASGSSSALLGTESGTSHLSIVSQDASKSISGTESLQVIESMLTPVR